MTTDEYLQPAPDTSIYELKQPYETLSEVDNCIRLYCVRYPDGWNLQIRSFKGIAKDYGDRGKPRRMIASVTVDLKTMRKMVAHMEKEGERYEPKEAGQ